MCIYQRFWLEFRAYKSIFSVSVLLPSNVGQVTNLQVLADTSPVDIHFTLPIGHSLYLLWSSDQATFVWSWTKFEIYMQGQLLFFFLYSFVIIFLCSYFILKYFWLFLCIISKPKIQHVLNSPNTFLLCTNKKKKLGNSSIWQNPLVCNPPL